MEGFNLMIGKAHTSCGGLAVFVIFFKRSRIGLFAFWNLLFALVCLRLN